MAKIVLTANQSHDHSVPTADVSQVRIEHPINWDQAVPRVSFRYSTGHVISSVYTGVTMSNLVTISGADYSTYINVVPPAPAETIQSNLERKLLQYLLDKNLIPAGTIS